MWSSDPVLFLCLAAKRLAINVLCTALLRHLRTGMVCVEWGAGGAGGTGGGMGGGREGKGGGRMIGVYVDAEWQKTHDCMLHEIGYT